MEGCKNCKLFEGIKDESLVALKTALGASERSFGKGEIIINQGDNTDKLGVVLEGNIEALHLSANGNSTTISILGASEVFADFLAADDTAHSPVSIIAGERCRVLFIPFGALFMPATGFAEERRLMLSNLAKIYASKYFMLMDRLICISSPTIRGKVLKYLTLMYNKTGTATFEIPLDREGLARYLNVDRSALSRELSFMKNEGLIEYYKSSFRILDKSLLRDGKFF